MNRGRDTPDQPVPLHQDVRRSTPAWVLWTSAGLAWASAAATAGLFALVGVAVDTVHAGGGSSTATIWAMVLLGVLAALFIGVGAWLSKWAASEAERRLRRAVVSRVFDLGVTATADRSGELLSLATTAVERTAHYRAAFLGPIVGALTTPLLVLGMMALTVDPVVAGWLALLILLVPLLIGGFQRVVRPIGGAYRRSQARLTAAFLEAIQALGTLVLARAAERTATDLAQRGEEYRRGLMRMLAGNQLLILVVDAAFSLSITVAAAAIAVTRIVAAELSLGDGVAIVLMTTLVIGPVDVIGQFFYIGIAGRATQRQISSHLSAAEPARPSRRATVDAVTGAPSSGSLVLEEVTGGWPGSEPVVRDLSFSVEPGERVALVGPSGIGKSTVAALIQAHLYPVAGGVLVDGIDTATVDPDLVRSRLAVVEQRTFLFLGTIAENLRVADSDASEEQLWAALGLAGLRAEIEAMPQGLATPVGEHGMLLSGGQAQRLAIARAALRDAPILVLDEPTSNVDLASEAAILAALDRLVTGRTVLMIAHRPGATLTADRVITLAGWAAA